MNAPIKSAALLFFCLATLAQAVGFTIAPAIAPAQDAIVTGTAGGDLSDADLSSMGILVADGTETEDENPVDGVFDSTTPAPEASTLFLMGAGVLVIVAAMRVNRSRERK